MNKSSPSTKGPPEETQEPESEELDDGREIGDFKTRYSCRAWWGIGCEAAYLIITLLVLFVILLLMITPVDKTATGIHHWFITSVAGPIDGKRFQYFIVAFAGALGGALFSAKWLIHSVAKGLWNEDRRLWRLFVPLTAAATTVIFAAVIQSGLISLFNTESFKNLEVAFAFGALVGYFSDSATGVLSNIAEVIFGTVRDKKK